MNELLTEIISIIGKHVLNDSAFHGSTEGRRLADLLWQYTGNPRSRAIAPGHANMRASEQVSRTVSLPLELDTRLTVIADQAGIPRDQLIANAVEALIFAGCNPG